MEDVKGKVMTVLGPIDPSDLGVTLTHEHLLMDYTKAVKSPEYGPDNLADIEVKMENLGKIRHFPFSVKANVTIDSVENAISELWLFKQAGGQTVVDVTTIGLRLKTEEISRIARESGVNVIYGTGYYFDAFVPEEAKMMNIQEMADVMVKEICEGVEGSGMRCGVIGEVGVSWPMTEFEKKSLKASALAQQQTGAPMIIHPGRHQQSPFDILNILDEAGADLSRTVMSHLDRLGLDDQKLLELAKRGCYMEYDLFGMECSHYQFVPDVDMLSDAQRIQKVKTLVEAGYGHRVVLAHDIHSKHRQVRYGGHGYAHLLEHIVPKMRDRGINQDAIDAIFKDNPKQWLTFV